MKLSDLLDEILQEWLDSPEHGKKVQQIWGVDGYVCVSNFIDYIREMDNDYNYELREAADSDGY